MKVGIIGAGFFGLSIASHLIKNHPEIEISIYEKEEDAFRAASKVNQARVHAGFHYGRDIKTAYRSSKLMNKFIDMYKDAVYENFSHFYGVSSIDSKISSENFFKTFSYLGIDLVKTSPNFEFNENLISDWYEVNEPTFNYKIIKNKLLDEIPSNVINFSSDVKCFNDKKDQIELEILNKDGVRKYDSFDVVFNTTYGSIEQFTQNNKNYKTIIELTEIALVTPTKELKNTGITLMDGPFFSLLPYPSTNYHSFTHVRYTPHMRGNSPFPLQNIKSNFNLMKRDASKYIPCLNDLEISESLFENKAILSDKEITDGRPIAIWNNANSKLFWNILGGKLDNIFDLLDWLDLFMRKQNG